MKLKIMLIISEDVIKVFIYLVRNDLNAMLTKTEKWEENLEHLNVKVTDFNIYDMFKNAGKDGSTEDAIVILVQNLDNKTFKKFAFIDDKLKKIEEETLKNKNEIANILAQEQMHHRAFNNLKEDTEKLVNTEIPQIKEQITKNKQHIDIQTQENYDKLTKRIEDMNLELQANIKNFEDMMKNLNHDSDRIKPKRSNQEIGFNEQDQKLLKDVNKRVLELDRTFKVFSQSINIEHVKSEISRISDNLIYKVNGQDHHELKETVNGLTHQMTFMKDTMSQLMEDRKIIDDMNWLRKKVENLSSSMLNLKITDNDSSNSHQLKNFITDGSKYLEVAVFNDFQKSYIREMDPLKRGYDELKRYVEEILLTLKTKASDKDLKNLEEFLSAKIEELKLSTHKKFADKIDTQKNVKYLDAQIKHIIEVYIKKMERGDNWLLAKKPVNGFSCASCEGYLGDLQDKNQFVAWNKYPVRDPSEKAYRVKIIFII